MDKITKAINTIKINGNHIDPESGILVRKLYEKHLAPEASEVAVEAFAEYVARQVSLARFAEYTEQPIKDMKDIKEEDFDYLANFWGQDLA